MKMRAINLPFNVGQKTINFTTQVLTSLPPREEPTIIQQEGWLMKRGAGFKAGGQEGLPFGSGGSSIEEDVPPSASRRGSAKAATTGPMSMTSLFYGKEEKRRYFMLLTTPAASGRRALDSTEGPKAELRYYKKRPETEQERASPKGSIILTADMDVSLEDNSILVHAPNRTYYLRPDALDGQAAKAKTSAAQWINAIRFALSGLRAHELQGAVGAGLNPHPMQDVRAMRIISLRPGAKLPGLSESNGSVGKAGGIPDGNADGLIGYICPFIELWHAEGIEAYERIVAHFGPAFTDMSRLRDHFQSRITQVDLELAILDQEMGHSAEVVVKEQRTIADVMKELHRTSQRHSSALREASKDFNKRVIVLIDSSTKELSSKLESIVERHSVAATYVEGAKKVLMESIEKVEKLQEALDLALAGQQSPEQTQRSTTTRMLRRKSDAPPPDPAKIESDLNDARQARRDASQLLVTTETKHAEAISKAMEELYKLEKLRLERLVMILEAGSDVEQRLVEKLNLEAGALEESLDSINAANDIRSTFARLKANAEKTRVKPRRKNSLFNRVDFSKLTEAGGEQ